MKLKNNSLEGFIKSIGGKKLICFGASKMPIDISEKHSVFNMESYIDYFVDNDPKKWGKAITINGKSFTIKSPEVLKEQSFNNHILFITSRFYYEIVPQLNNIKNLDNALCYIYPMFKFYDETQAKTQTSIEPTEIRSNRILFFCKTSYQIIVAAQLKCTRFKNYTADIIITDHLSNAKKVVKNIKNSRLFENAYYFSSRQVIKQNNISYHKFILDECLMFKNYLTLDKPYDLFLFANYGPDIEYVYRSAETLNHSVKPYMFEDGFSSYTDYFGGFFKEYYFYSRFLGENKYLHKAYLNIKALYLFNPELITWKPYFPVKSIEKITQDSNELIKELNTIFDFDKCEDKYSEDIIFFEESFFADNIETDDIEIIKKLAEKFGKENVFIKIHPRNKVNRFKKLGYKTNTNTEIPWQLILLNIDIKDKLLISISSDAVLNPYTIMGVKTNSVLLINGTTKLNPLFKDIVRFKKNMCEKYPNLFYMPDSLDEFFDTYIKKGV